MKKDYASVHLNVKSTKNHLLHYHLQAQLKVIFMIELLS